MSQSTEMFNDFSKKKKSKFSQEEDQKLIRLVDEHGVNSWNVIAKLLNNRTPRQCRDRWNHYLSCDSSNFEWNAEEEKVLMDKYLEMGCKWTAIAKFFPGKTAASVRNRCCRIMRSSGKPEMLSKNNPQPKSTLGNAPPITRIRLPSCESLPFPNHISYLL